MHEIRITFTEENGIIKGRVFLDDEMLAESPDYTTEDEAVAQINKMLAALQKSVTPNEEVNNV